MLLLNIDLNEHIIENGNRILHINFYKRNVIINIMYGYSFDKTNEKEIKNQWEHLYKYYQENKKINDLIIIGDWNFGENHKKVNLRLYNTINNYIKLMDIQFIQNEIICAQNNCIHDDCTYFPGILKKNKQQFIKTRIDHVGITSSKNFEILELKCNHDMLVYSDHVAQLLTINLNINETMIVQNEFYIKRNEEKERLSILIFQSLKNLLKKRMKEIYSWERDFADRFRLYEDYEVYMMYFCNIITNFYEMKYQSKV